jgi:hypothetical protein
MILQTLLRLAVRSSLALAQFPWCYAVRFSLALAQTLAITWCYTVRTSLLHLHKHWIPPSDLLHLLLMLHFQILPVFSCTCTLLKLRREIFSGSFANAWCFAVGSSPALAQSLMLRCQIFSCVCTNTSLSDLLDLLLHLHALLMLRCQISSCMCLHTWCACISESRSDKMEKGQWSSLVLCFFATFWLSSLNLVS